MFGMQDLSITIALLLSMSSALMCVVYGAFKWNEGGDEE